MYSKTLKKSISFNFCNITKLSGYFKIKEPYTKQVTKQSFNKYDFNNDILDLIAKYKGSLPFYNDNYMKNSFAKYPEAFLPENTMLKANKLQKFKNDLMKEYSMNENEATEVISLAPKIIDHEKHYLEDNLPFIKQLFPNKQTIIDYPKLILVSNESYNRLITYMNIYCEFINNPTDDTNQSNTTNKSSRNFITNTNTTKSSYKTQDFIQLITQNPLLATANPDDVLSLLNYLDDLTIRPSNNGLPDKKVYNPNHYSKSTITSINNFDKYKFILKNPNILLTSPHEFRNLFKVMEEKFTFDNVEVFNMIEQYPDLVFINKSNLLNKKYEMFNNINIDRLTFIEFIRQYPFLLLKSFNSYIKKYNFLTEDKKFSLEKKELNIYPYVLLFDFAKEIKPKMTLLLSEEKKHIMSVDEAFSLDKNEFCEKINVSVNSYDDLVNEEMKRSNLGVYLNERDLMFHYDRITYI